MAALKDTKLQIFHEHYRDTCSIIQVQRGTRDKYFYSILALLALLLLDFRSPGGFAGIMSGLARVQLGDSAVVDLKYVRSVLWFLLLGLTLRYGQSTLNIERQYSYVHRLEEVLQSELHASLAREGRAYLAHYPPFLNWAHALYTIAFPAVLCAIVLTWTAESATTADWYDPIFWLNLVISSALIISILLYLHALHIKFVQTCFDIARQLWRRLFPRS